MDGRSRRRRCTPLSRFCPNSGVWPNPTRWTRLSRSPPAPRARPRTAANSSKTVTQQTGIRPRVISGTEEARLIHLAAVYGVSVPGDVAVVIDIGGGSVEVTRGAGANVELGRSFKLGVIRLTERFVKTDPLEPRDERKLVRHIDAEIGKYLRPDRARRLRARHRHVRHDPQPRRGGVGSRRARARRAAAQPPRSPPSRSAACARSWSRSTSKSGCACPGSSRGAPTSRSPARSWSTSCCAGSAPNEITLCDLSLREGLVLDYIARHRKEIAQADRYPDVRRRSVFELAERCNYWPEHSQHVARLAIGTVRPDARDSRPDRSRARMARVRRDPARHRRPYQLRRAPQALVLPREERRSPRLRAGRNRDHRARRPLPSAGDAEAQARRLLRAAPPQCAATVRTLAAILRLAESLDRSHAQTDHRPRAARSRRRRPAAAADDGRRGAGALGRRAPRRALRTTDGKAAPHRGQRPRIC